MKLLPAKSWELEDLSTELEETVDDVDNPVVDVLFNFVCDTIHPALTRSLIG